MDTIPKQKNTISDSELHAGRDAHIGDNITYVINEQMVKIPRLLTTGIPINAAHILGRDTELEIISKHLSENKPIVLVNGIGGIGKTSVATKYVVQFGKDYAHLAWLTVQSSLAETFVNNIVLLKSLHIEQDIRNLIEGKQINNAFQLVLHQLNNLESTLIVLDNANDLGDLLINKTLFDTAHCCFLITSREQPPEWTTVNIEHLPPDEAVKLFQKFAPSVCTDAIHRVSPSSEAIKSLLEKLFYHTLLIELVAKALENADFSFDELQTMIETRFIHDEKLNEDIVSTGTHGDSLKDNPKRAKIEDYIWLIFKEVKNLGDTAQQILKVMALLPVATAYKREDLKKHFVIFDLKHDIAQTLTVLVERGWLEKEKTADNKPAYKMHPLIADVVVKHLEVNAEFAEKYIGIVADSSFYNNINPEHNLFEKNEIKLFAERLKQLFFNENSENISKLLNSLWSIDFQMGFYSNAIQNSERSLRIAETIFEKNHRIITARQSNLANLYSELGRYDEAVYLLENVLENDIKNYGEHHTNTAGSQSNLAETYRILGRNYEAIILLNKAIESDIKNFGRYHPNIAVYESNLGLVYRDLGLYNEAIELLKSALENNLKNFNKDHPTIANCQSNLGLLYSDICSYKEAASLMKIALESDMINFGKDHPIVANRLNNLASVYYLIGKPSEAKTLWQKAYFILLKNFGDEHPNTIFVKTHSEM